MHLKMVLLTKVALDDELEVCCIVFLMADVVLKLQVYDVTDVGWSFN